MKRCKCGNESKDHAPRCNNCGRKFMERAIKPPEKHRRHRHEKRKVANG